MKPSCEVRENLLKYLHDLEKRLKEVKGKKENEYFENFYSGELRGIKAAISFIDGDLYYHKEKGLMNR